jgi:hypothetical protein
VVLVSVAAYRWVFRHVADYGIAPDRNRDDFGPYRLALLLADYTSPKDPHEGAWPGRDTLAAGLGVDPTTVKRWTARLREAGVIEVQEYAGPPTGKRGRKSHRYLIPGFLASLDLRLTPSVVTPPKSEEDRRDLEGTPSGETSDKTDELEGTDDELEGVEPRIGGHGHAQDAPRGRYLHGGKEGASAAADPPPPLGARGTRTALPTTSPAGRVAAGGSTWKTPGS